MRGVGVGSNHIHIIKPIHYRYIGVPKNIGSTQKTHKRDQKKLHTSYVPFSSKTSFWGMSGGAFLRRVWDQTHHREMQPTGCLHHSRGWLRRGGGMVG